MTETTSTFNDMLSALLERGARLVDWSGHERDDRRAEALCEALLSNRGEASGVAIASEVLSRYEAMDAAEKTAFFVALAEHFDVDPDAVAAASDRFLKERSHTALARLSAAAEPRRQALLRRLNLAPEGTRRLVAMRSDLLGLIGETPNLKRVDADFQHLLQSWFNRGFLVLKPIDWNSSATLLEKIIAYEAVHQIGDWEELRRRVQPSDRRCFAFFHPAMPDEPLIFVEVALTTGIASSIQEVLAPFREPLPAAKASTAVFYSISNCQTGLKGVSFGAFLIKQVAQDLKRELPNLKTFVTLSPAPGFGRWMRAAAKETPDGPAAKAASLTADLDWPRDAEKVATARPVIMGLAARYFLEAKRDDGGPADSVARFHLGNGATLTQINWLGDRSAKGLAQSCGVMVNYLYELEQIEARHEDYAERRLVHASRQVRAALASAEPLNSAS